MTAHVHDPSAQRDLQADPAPSGWLPTAWTRPWWLLPAIVGTIIVGGLVVAGVISLSAVVYLGLFGGMMLMHMGGHGHGGHGTTGGGHHGHGAEATDGAANLTQPSSGAQPDERGSAAGLDPRPSNDLNGSETQDHDQHGSHGCCG